MALNLNLRQLHEAGVSIWLDTLSREVLDGGEFAELIRDWSVTGATSNPTIFANQLGPLRRPATKAGHGRVRDPREFFFSLGLDDVRAAARPLIPAYEQEGQGRGSSRSSAPPIWPTTPGRP